MVSLFGCGGGESGSTGNDDAVVADTGGSGSNAGTGTDTGGSLTCQEVPSETAGPYPADGSTASNRTYNVLELDGIVRQDIRGNINGSSVQDGALLTLNITLTDVTNDCADLQGYAIYIWHCTSDGDYSVYTEGTLEQHYLRGVQQTDGNGQARFITIMPGCYTGRVPHIHVEIYSSLAEAKTASQNVKTTQFAFPNDIMQALYSTSSEYSGSIRAFNGITFATDNVFGDGYDEQMLAITGDSANGYEASITISIAA